MQGVEEFDSIEMKLAALLGDAPPLPAAPPKMVGEVVGDTYEILGELGEGGMGQVFVARHARTGGEVALKVIRPKHVNEDDFIERFELEAKNTAALNHPNIVKVFDYGVDDGLAYIAMELARGQSVGELLDERQILKPAEATAICGHTLRALQVAHDAGLVHRDIKPDNILATYDGDSWFVKVLDFGIAHAFEVERVGPQSVIGSPHSMAPEQFQADGEITPRADLYALGCTMFAMLTGYPPFHGTFWELAVFHAEQAPPPLDDVPEPLADWVYWLLAKSPDDRPESAQVALDALLEVERGRSVSPVMGSRLPTVPTSFVGREAELAAMTRLRQEDVRLITLTGIGGLGKTRLSVEWGHQNARRFAGAYFCDLAETRTLEAICVVVAHAVEAVLGDGELSEAVGRILAGRGRALVILDNFEQIVDHAASTVGMWQQMAPDVTFIVTSRHRLNLHGEHIIDVSPLPTTEPECDGVRLFIDRATQSHPGFELDQENHRAIRELVEQLDGLPLAIEMAASRVRSMSPEKILNRLGERFHLLRSSRRDISDRQLTMRAALDWSWELLDPAEKDALRQCAVFAGSFDIEAAEAVLDLSEHGDPWVVDVIEALVDKSLVRRLADDRCSMFVSVHDYALEKLGAADMAEATRARHLTHYAGHRVSPGSGLDIGNLRAALHYGIENRPGLDLASVALALARFANAFGPIGVTIALVEQVLEVWREDSPTMAFLYQSLSLLRVRGGDDDGAIADAEVAVAIAHRLGDAPIQAQTMLRLVQVHELAGRFAASERLLPEASQLARECDSERILFMLRWVLSGIRCRQGRLVEARTILDEMLATAQQSNNRFDEGTTRNHLAWLSLCEGDGDAMLAHAHRGLDLHASGGPIQQGWAYLTLGKAFQHRGDYAAAVAHFEAGSSLARESSEPMLGCSILLSRTAVGVLWGHPSARDWVRDLLDVSRERYPLHRLRALLLEACILRGQDTNALALVDSAIEEAADHPGVIRHLARLTRVMLVADVAPTLAMADELADVLNTIDGRGAPHWLGVEALQVKVGCHLERAAIFLAMGEFDAALEASTAARDCLPFERMAADWQLRDLCTRMELLVAYDRTGEALELARQVEEMRERLDLYPEAWLSQIVEQALAKVHEAT